MGQRIPMQPGRAGQAHGARARRGPPARSRLVVIGASRGGFEALQQLLGDLPASFSAPIVVVLHRNRTPEPLLAQFLGEASTLPVSEVTDKQPLQPGHVHLAPPDYHVLVERDSLALSIDAPVQWSRPSIDLLFETAADSFGRNAIGVILTGANADGARGAGRIEAMGGVIAVQDPATAETPTMPRAAVDATEAAAVRPLPEMAAWLAEQVAKPIEDPI